MKVRSSIKPAYKECEIIERRGNIKIICGNPKHRQRQG